MKKLTQAEQAFWMGLVLAAVLAAVIFALVNMEHNRDDDDDGGQTAKRVPIEVTPTGGPSGGQAVPVPTAQNMSTTPIDLSFLNTDLGAGVNGHAPGIPLPLGN